MGLLSTLRSIIVSRHIEMGWRLLKALIILFALSGAYLCIRGFPESVVRAVEERLAANGYDVRIQRLVLHPADGLVAERVQVFRSEEARHPVLDAEAVACTFDWRAWLDGEHGLRRITLRGGNVFVPTDGGPLRDLSAANVVHGKHVSLQIVREADRLNVTYLQGRMAGCEVKGSGVWIRSPADHSEPAPSLPWSPQTGEEGGTWLAEVPGLLQALTVEGRAFIYVRFRVDEAAPEASQMRLVSGGTDIRYRGLLIDEYKLHVDVDERGLEIPLFFVEGNGDRLEGRAAYARTEQLIEGYVNSGLPPVYWRNWLPASWRETMETARVHCLGPSEIELVLGPSAPKDFGKHIRARIKAEDIDAHGVWIDSIEADAIRDNEDVHVYNIDARVGHGDAGGPARGDFMYHMDNGTYAGHLQASFDPHEVLPVAGYSKTAARIIQAVAVVDVLPEIDVAFSGKIPPEPEFHFAGDMRGTQFAYAGSLVERFEATFLVTNNVMRLDPLRVERREGTVTGWYEQDFGNKITKLDIRSSVEPKALARVGGGVVERILRPFRFAGAVDLEVSGRVDYATRKTTDYRAQGEARQVDWRWINIDSVSMTWVAQGDRIMMTNVVMSLYDGTLTGHVDLKGVGREEPVHYQATGVVHDVSLHGFLRDVRQSEDDLQAGRLSGRFQLAGLSEDDWRASIGGTGRVRITDGEVFKIRLLGGLSQLLGRIYPSLGFAVQTDVRADFEIAERSVIADEIRIEGNFLSLRGWGRYVLDDELDFKVQVLPLKRGLLVDALRFVTYPLSRLLQFRLEGTLSEPVWGIDNLPRNLLRRLETEDDE